MGTRGAVDAIVGAAVRTIVCVFGDVARFASSN
jgi:hypothetical protein